MDSEKKQYVGLFGSTGIMMLVIVEAQAKQRRKGMEKTTFLQRIWSGRIFKFSRSHSTKNSIPDLSRSSFYHLEIKKIDGQEETNKF
ncbi:hypothetical protein H5410_033590 [Solanum commersonii]|uniref:Uncharacterized protein n=1 Tax=Solanum commersonii TaxID=4109 RepID=A0A9J5YT11_SOLCO|nr:hypothetical protein H5410_033590 [Solanum commersonii]